jgi:hypothetical protein
MDHPILSIAEFAEHFRRKAKDLGYDDCEMLDLEPTQMLCWASARAAFGVVISGEAVIGNRHYAVSRCSHEEFEVPDAQGLHVLAGPDGARVFIARLGPLASPILHGKAAYGTDHPLQ